MRIRAEQKQWPVGQGGFATGEIMFDELGSTLTYVYDCGSDTLVPLRDAITDFAGDREVIDVAFLSHLDSDHVNGIDTLLGICAVRHVVLPYLDSFAILDVIGRSLEEGSYTVSLGQFLAGPVAWLQARGVGHVWMVGHASGNESRAMRRPNEESKYDYLDTPEFVEIRRGRGPASLGVIGSFRSDTLPGGEQVSLLDSGAMLAASPNGKDIGWWFVPYAPPAEQVRLDNLKKALLAIGLDMDTASAQDILGFIRNRREEFKACYSTISSIHNNVSLCLYSSPPITGDTGVFRTYWRRNRHSDLDYSRKPGWMHTGDAPWGKKYQVKAVQTFYSNYWDAVGVLVVPHHGSEHNFSVEALKMCSPDFALLPYGIGNRHKHPHGMVEDMLQRTMICRVDVTQQPNGGFKTVIDI